MNLEQAINELTDLTHREEAKLVVYLEEQGCRGFINEESMCPLAVYFSNKTNGAVIVDGSYIQEAMSDAPMIVSPQYLQSFVKHFDGGDYPQLVAEDDDFGQERCGEEDS